MKEKNLEKSNYYQYITEVLESNRGKMDSLLKTKRLIFNSNKYLVYRKNYIDITTLSEFKSPKASKFPITKNKDILPLTLPQFSNDIYPNLNLKTVKENNLISPKDKTKSTKIQKNLFNSRNNKYNISENDIFCRTQTFIPLTKNDNGTKNVINNFFQKSSKKVSSKKNLFYKKMDYEYFIKNNYTFINPNQIISQKSKINIQNILYNLLLGEEAENYSNLSYEEDLIFNDVDFYNKLIIDKLNSLKNSGMDPQNFHNTVKTKKLGEVSENNKNQNIIELKLTSFVIEINQLNNNDDNNKFSFNLPFDLVPLFYYESMKNTPLILIGLLKYENNKFELDLSQLLNILNNNNGYINIPKNTKKDSLFIQYKKNLKMNSINKKTIQRNKYCNSQNSEMSEKESKKDDTSNYKFTHKKHSKTNTDLNKILLNNEKLYKETWNELGLLWLTNDNKKFKITIKIPEIEIKIDKIIIKKFVNVELLLLLLGNNFNCWEFYILKYLLSFKIFRTLMQIYYSKINNSYKYLVEITKNEAFPDYIDVIHNKNDYIINLSQKKTITGGMKTKKFFFIYSDSKSNYYKILHNFCLKIFNNKVNPNNKFNFHFNYEQMRKINHISKKQGLCPFFAKLVENDFKSKKIKLNYDFLDRYKFSDNKNLAEHQPNLSPEHLSASIDKKNDGNKITVKQPILETIEYIPENSEKFQGFCYQSNINEFAERGVPVEILDEICKDNNMENWPNILIKVKDINENINVLKNDNYEKSKSKNIKVTLKNE